jgi:SAM-dependent methyltransferase
VILPRRGASLVEVIPERIDIRGHPRSLVEQEHLNRYVWASRHVSGQILDVACGNGYGSSLLARCGTLSGLDKDHDAVTVARRRVPAAKFTEAVLPALPYGDGSFDAVVTFETLEHVAQDAEYVAELARVLRPGGLLLLSTPNAAVSSPSGSISNPWHVREYTLDQLRALLGGFINLDIFMQGPVREGIAARVALRASARLPRLPRPRWWDHVAYGDGRVEPWDGRIPWYWVVRARNAPAAAVGD